MSSSSASEGVAPPGDGAQNDDGKSSMLECNVCLENARDPVVTMCGHLYCWPCLFRWLRSGHNVCPVCKAGVARENVIPLYGRGSSGTRASSSEADRPGAPAASSDSAPAGGLGGGDGDVPNRPAAQRMEPPPRQEEQWWGAGGAPGGATFTVGYGFFPSLFGLQFHTFGGPATRGAGAPQSREELQQQMVSRALFALGVAMVLMLMLL